MAKDLTEAAVKATDPGDVAARNGSDELEAHNELDEVDVHDDDDLDVHDDDDLDVHDDLDELDVHDDLDELDVHDDVDDLEDHDDLDELDVHDDVDELEDHDDLEVHDQFEDRGGLEQLEEPDLHEELREYPDYGYEGDADIETVPSPIARSQKFVIDRSRPYESPGRSARNHWHLIAVFALLGVLLGAAFGIVRPPTYTAESRLVVGKTAQLSNLASVPGLDAAGESLASAYSRLVSTDEVLAGAAERLGGPIDGSLSGSPIPESPIVRVEASAKSSEAAIALARAGSAALVAAVDDLNEQQNKSSEDLLEQYRAAAKLQIEATSRLVLLQAAAGANPTPGQQDQINAAETEVAAAKVKADALDEAFKGTFNPSAINTQVIQPAGAPTATGDNRKSTIQAGVLIGLVAGGLLGLGLAMWIDLRARSRQ